MAWTSPCARRTRPRNTWTSRCWRRWANVAAAAGERRESEMTRIYDALRKAETHRDRRALSAAPAPPPAAPEPEPAWAPPGAESALVPLPLLGGVDMTEDAAR